MVELISTNGVHFIASDEDTPRLIKFGCVPAEPEKKPAPKRRAPRKTQKSQDK